MTPDGVSPVDAGLIEDALQAGVVHPAVKRQIGQVHIRPQQFVLMGDVHDDVGVEIVDQFLQLGAAVNRIVFAAAEVEHLVAPTAPRQFGRRVEIVLEQNAEGFFVVDAVAHHDAGADQRDADGACRFLLFDLRAAHAPLIRGEGRTFVIPLVFGNQFQPQHVASGPGELHKLRTSPAVGAAKSPSQQAGLNAPLVEFLIVALHHQARFGPAEMIGLHPHNHPHRAVGDGGFEGNSRHQKQDRQDRQIDARPPRRDV